MKQLQQFLSQSRSATVSQRESSVHLPYLNKEQKNQLIEKCDRAVKQENINDIISYRYLDTLEQDQKSFFDAYSTSSTQSSINRYPRARSVTSNERKNNTDGQLNRQKAKNNNNNSYIHISRQSILRERPQNNNINTNERSSSTVGKGLDQIKVQILLNNQLKSKIEKKEKGWDQYKNQLTKGVQKSSAADKISHLITTPLVNHKNYFDRKREIEQNLNLQSYGLNVYNYSVLDKRTKTFFTSQCKEEAKEYQEVLKQNEKKLNKDLQELIQGQKVQHNRKHSNKYSISKHLEQNRFVNPQLIF